MFINPDKTALILLGASRFPNYDGQDRKSFSNAHDKIKHYFLKSDFGPCLSKVCDLFDSEYDASKQITEVGNFLGKHMSLEDVFVYIVTHGKFDEETGRFYLMVQTSRDNSDREIRDDTYILFETLLKTTLSSGRPRVYFIVDACYSGKIHPHYGDHVPSHESPTPPTEWYGKSVRGGHATILTANSLEEPGPVDGKDNERPPLFTRCLLEILENGIERGFSDGLSLRALEYAINECYHEKLPELKGPDFLKDTTRAQVSDRDLLGPDSEERLLDIPVFLNNDLSNVRKLFREARREKIERKMVAVKNSKLRTKNEQLHEEKSKLTTENKQLQEEKSELTAENKQLQEEKSKLTAENKQLQEEKSKLTARSQVLKESSEDLKEEIRAADKCSAELTAQTKQNEFLKHTNRRLFWLVCLLAVLSFAVCVLALSYEPAFWELLVSWININVTAE